MGMSGGMGSSGGAATLPGSATNWSAAYGGVPNVPNPGASAASAIGADVSNLGNLYALGQGTNQFNEGQLISNYQSAIPDYSALATQQSSNIGSELSGQVPQDVLNQILQNAAERGIVTGSPGGPNANAAYLRSLGLTSLGLQEQGVNDLKTAVSEAPIAQPFDISKMFTTPDEWQQAQMAANLYKSAPIPSAAAGAARAAGMVGGGGGTSITLPGGGGAAPSLSPWWEPGQTVLDSNAPDITTTHSDPYAQWNQWASGLPSTTTATNNGFNMEDYAYATGSNPQDTYGGLEYDLPSMWNDFEQLPDSYFQ